MFSIYREPPKYEIRSSFPHAIKIPSLNTLAFDSESHEGKNSYLKFQPIAIPSSSQEETCSKRTNLYETSDTIPFVIPIFEPSILSLGDPQKYLFAKCSLFNLPNDYSQNKTHGKVFQTPQQHVKHRRPFYKKKKTPRRLHHLEKEMDSLHIDLQSKDISKPLKKSKTKPSKRLHQLERELDALRIDIGISPSIPSKKCFEKRNMS